MTQLQHPPILGTSQATWADEAACARDARRARRARRRCATPSSSSKARWAPARPPSCATCCTRWASRAASRARPTRSSRPTSSTALAISHFDFYRFDDPQEWEDAGLRDLFGAPGLKLVEWAEKAAAAAARARPARDDHATRRDDSRRPIRRDDPDRPAIDRQSGFMKRRDLLRGGSLVLCLGATDLAFGATIVAVRIWPAADYTRVTIESDQPLVARNFVAENPYRLVVDIDNLELSPALRDLVGKVRADDPFIAGVRVGQNQPRVVRLVLDLKQAVAPQQFTLAPVAAYQHRLVFDLYPVQGAGSAARAAARQGAGRAGGRAGGAGRARRVHRQDPERRQRAVAAGHRRRDDPPRRCPRPRRASPTPARPRAAARASTPRRWRCRRRSPRARSRPRKSARSTACWSSRSTRATAARIPARSGPSGLKEKDVVLADRDAAARAPQRQARRARADDARLRLLRAARRAREEGRARAGRPVRLDPRRRVLHARGARRVGVRAEPGRRLERRGALDGQPRERGRLGRRRQRRRSRTPR